jgi:dehydrogenase/reductase SDR family member 12
MARITESLEVPAAPEAAFDHVADFTTTVGWDPSIVAAEPLDDGPIGLGSRFRVKLRLGPTTVPLDYEITTYERPVRVVLRTRGLLHNGEDDVRFSPAGDGGSAVDWRARFAVRGPIGWLTDPALGVGFRRTAAAAVAGLERSLHDLARQR